MEMDYQSLQKKQQLLDSMLSDYANCKQSFSNWCHFRKLRSDPLLHDIVVRKASLPFLHEPCLRDAVYHNKPGAKINHKSALFNLANLRCIVHRSLEDWSSLGPYNDILALVQRSHIDYQLLQASRGHKVDFEKLQIQFNLLCNDLELLSDKLSLKLTILKDDILDWCYVNGLKFHIEIKQKPFATPDSVLVQVL